MQKLFPGMRPDRIAKHGVVGAPLEAVFAGVLAIGPADRQLIELGHRVIDDSAVANGRRDHAIAAITEQVDQPVQIGACDRQLRTDCNGRLGIIRLRDISIRLSHPGSLRDLLLKAVDVLEPEVIKPPDTGFCRHWIQLLTIG